MLYIILFFLQSFCFIKQSYGHGYLADPPARSSAWLVDQDFSKCCQYYNHIEMSCGGTFHQWVVNKGKCSICGEAHDLKPKLLGVGDAMYLGKIVRTYTQGSIIPVTVVLTANHLGNFEFRVCSIDNDPNEDATQSCLDLNVLQTENGLTDYPIESSYTTVYLNVTLPPDLVCNHCVFQWKYITGNSWGSSNGKSCLGCGLENEEFYGCSDIAIVSSVEAIVDPSSPPLAIAGSVESIVDPLSPPLAIAGSVESIVDPSSSPPLTAASSSSTTTTMTEVAIETTTYSEKCTSAVVFSQSFDLRAIMDKYCQTICPNKCPSDKIDGNEIRYEACVNSCNILCTCQ